MRRVLYLRLQDQSGAKAGGFRARGATGAHACGSEATRLRRGHGPGQKTGQRMSV